MLYIAVGIPVSGHGIVLRMPTKRKLVGQDRQIGPNDCAEHLWHSLGGVLFPAVPLWPAPMEGSPTTVAKNCVGHIVLDGVAIIGARLLCRSVVERRLCGGQPLRCDGQFYSRTTSFAHKVGNTGAAGIYGSGISNIRT